MKYHGLLFGCVLIFAGIVTAEGLHRDETPAFPLAQNIVLQDTIPPETPRDPQAISSGESRIVHIIAADSVHGYVENGERMRRIFLNVHLREDVTDL